MILCMVLVVPAHLDGMPASGVQQALFFGLVKYRAAVPKLPRHLPLDGGSGPRLHHTTDGASSVRVCHPCLSAVAALAMPARHP